MANFPTSVASDTTLYTAVNNVSTNLNGGINDLVTTVTVVSTTSFPSSGIITIGLEAISYTSKNATQFLSCTRGADGTTAASHADGASVLHAVVAAHHNASKDEIKAVEQALADRFGNGTAFLTTDEWVDVRRYASINAAVTAIGSTPTTLVISSAQTLTANLTTPSTLSLVILKGGSIVKASTYTLAIGGPFAAGPYQVFSGFAAANISFENTAFMDVLPEWFGAVGDDSTDDSTAFQLCLDVVAQSAFKPKITIMAKKYKIATGLTITTPQGMRICGQVGGSYTAGGVGFTNKVSTLRYTGSGSAFTVGNGSNSATGFIMENLFLNGTGGSGDGLYLNYAAGSSFRDMTVANFDSSGKAGIKILGTQLATFESIGFDTCWYGAWSVGSGFENTTLHFSNCTFNTNTKYGFYDTGSSGTVFQGCTFQDTAGSAIFVDTTGFTHNSMTIRDIYIAGSNTSIAGHAIDILGDTTTKSWNFLLENGFFASPGASQTAHIRLRYTRQALIFSPRIGQIATPNFIVDPSTNLEFSFYGWNTALGDIEDGSSVAVPWPRLGVEQPYWLTSLSNLRAKKDLEIVGDEILDATKKHYWDGSAGAGGDTYTSETSGNVLVDKVGNTDILTRTSSDVYTVPITDYSATSTIVGWSAFNLKSIYYKETGKTVDVWFSLQGTSDQTTITFTLPFTVANLVTFTSPSRATNNGVDLTTPGMVLITKNSATVQIFKDYAFGAWTNSGTKEVSGHFRFDKV